MTVTYTAEVATCRGLGCFPKLLTRWRGSIYKLIWMDLFTFLIVYYFLRILYCYVLNPDQKMLFENIASYCLWHANLIPVSFVLGFYVSIVMKRWWEQYLYIPWPDSIAVLISAHVQGNSERSRVIRRTVMRYVCVCQAIILAYMSPRIKLRFATWDHFVNAGLLQESEKLIFQKLSQKFPALPLHWLPIVWSASIVIRARKEGLIRDDCAVKTIVDELNRHRGRCSMLIAYDFISVPLVYTQVVTLAVYSYFLGALMGKQEIATTSSYTSFPFFSTLEFFFYMGWLKVAEVLINPFGDDDDDFEINWMIDRHLQVSYMIVDEMHHEHPELVRDQYWDEVFPSELPYADESSKREEPPESSTAKIGLTHNYPDQLGASSAGSLLAPLNADRNMQSPSSRGSATSLKSTESKAVSSSSSEGSSKIDLDTLPTRKKVGISLAGDDLSDFERLRVERVRRRMLRKPAPMSLVRERSNVNPNMATQTIDLLSARDLNSSDSELLNVGATANANDIGESVRATTSSVARSEERTSQDPSTAFHSLYSYRSSLESTRRKDNENGGSDQEA